jgi:hypothetical protein
MARWVLNRQQGVLQQVNGQDPDTYLIIIWLSTIIATITVIICTLLVLSPISSCPMAVVQCLNQHP